MAQALFKVVVRNHSKEAIVRPPFDTVTKGNANGIVVKNNTKMRVWVTVPAGVTEFQAGGTKDPVIVHEVASKGTLTLPVHAQAADGAYSFSDLLRGDVQLRAR
jgi:hypothetical protein